MLRTRITIVCTSRRQVARGSCLTVWTKCFKIQGSPFLSRAEPLVSRAVRNQPDWNEKYRQRVRELLPSFEPERLIRSLEQLDERLRPEFLKLDPNCGPARDELLAQWRERLTNRFTSIADQLQQPDPPAPPAEEPPTEEPIVLEVDQTIELYDWYPRQETPPSQLTTVDGEPATYRIDSAGAEDCIASWRRSVQLPRGRYRLTAELRGESITPRAK